MVKVNINTLESSRDPLPDFLVGLAAESLLDLSWTDAALGVQDFGWWQEEHNYPPLTETQKYEGETLTVDSDRKVVVVTHGVAPKTADELAAERKARVPSEVTMRQARLELLSAGKLSSVDAAIDAMPEPQRSAARIEWEYSSSVRRDNALILALGPALGMSEAQIDDWFVAAAKR